ncbi:MAG: MOSC domain-containing protein [Pseudomonadota bacterium]
MTSLKGQVHSVYVGVEGVLGKERKASIDVELDGIVGDRHRSFEREAWESGDKQPGGVRRRNERQWSAVSIEELYEISKKLGTVKDLTAASLGANLCISGVPELSRSPKGSILKFPSGAELIVEEYNPPCHDMGKSIAEDYETTSGEELGSTAFPKASQLTRGVVGIVDVPGAIAEGDEVLVEVYATPAWLLRSD